MPARAIHEHNKASVFQKYDADGSGVLDQKEFEELYDVIKAEMQEELAKEQTMQKKNVLMKRRFKVLLFLAILLVGFLGLSVIANFLTTQMLLEASKDSNVNSGGIMTARAGEGEAIVQMSEARQEGVPLGILPLLPHSDLMKVEALMVTRNTLNMSDPEVAEMTRTFTQANFSQYEYRQALRVTSYRWYSNLTMTFEVEGGHSIVIDRDDAFLQLNNGDTHPVCAGDATCAMTTLSGVNVTARTEELEALLEVDEEGASGRELFGSWGGGGSCRRALSAGVQTNDRRLSHAAKSRDSFLRSACNYQGGFMQYLISKRMCCIRNLIASGQLSDCCFVTYDDYIAEMGSCWRYRVLRYSFSFF